MRVLPIRINGRPAREIFYDYLRSQAERALDRRLAVYEKLKTPGDVRAYQKQARKKLQACFGNLPKPTPLGAEVVGRIRRPKYTIEKIIYQSQPGHYVTALLYLPPGRGPHPAVLLPPGHTDNGKAGYQHTCHLLATNDLAAFCIDPIGQGERHQLIEPDGRALSPPTWEHTVVAPGCVVVGRNVATYMLWDVMRGLDYLVGRTDIDGGRIGCTGNSGGGMMTCYMMAMDDRIACAAPSCYVTSYSRLLATIGPQDPEQNIHGLLGRGLDHADYLIIRAPKPTLICCATRDFFDIEGTWQAFRPAKRIYTRLGLADRVDLAETDWTHGFSTHLRVAAVRRMRRWLLGVDDEIVEKPTPLLRAGKLWCTPTGETLRLPGAKSVFDINRELGQRLARRRRRFWQTATKKRALAEVRRVSRIRKLVDLPEPALTRTGALRRGKSRMEKMIFEPEEGVLLPAVAFVPPRPGGRRYLYLEGRGLAVAAGPTGPVRRLAEAGHFVLAADLRGLGETRRRKGRYSLGQFAGADWAEATIAYLLDRPILAMRAEDTLILARYLRRLGGLRRSVHLVATGPAGPPALHAAALEPGLFGSVTIRRSLVSWSDILRQTYTKNQLAGLVQGALAVYDLDDLAGSLGGKLTVLEPIDATGRRIKQPLRAGK